MADAACDVCGQSYPQDELRRHERIEQERLDHEAEWAFAEARGRGRPRWFTRSRRDPATLLNTPRYRYVRRSYNVCPTCAEAVGQMENRAQSDQRRAAMIVGGIAIGTATILLILQLVRPDFYSVLGLHQDRTLQSDQRTYVPPSSTPYKPPFSATTPTDSH